MKPSKKKNVQDVNQNDLSGKKPSKIDNYFRSAPKPFIVDKIGDPETTKAFYVEELKKKLKKNVVEIKSTDRPVDIEVTANAVEEINEDHGACALVSEHRSKVSDTLNECAGCKHWETKYKDLKKVYLNQSVHFSEVNIKYNVLLKLKSISCRPDEKETTTNESNGDIFSPNQLKILQNMSLDKKNDSTFIHQCLKYAYKNDLNVLSGKTLKGTVESVKFHEGGREEIVPKKAPLSPDKVDRIKELFIDRIMKCDIDSTSFEARIKDSNINKLFATSINNISNKNG